MQHRYRPFLLAALVVFGAAPAGATELEVTHWWTSGGEAAAVAELAGGRTCLGIGAVVDPYRRHAKRFGYNTIREYRACSRLLSLPLMH